jgi:DNA gyrase/topoisomerase IV subunit A
MDEAADVSRERRIKQLIGRLRRSAALLVASRRRHEVVEVVGEAATDEEATRAVSELLDIDEDRAAEVVEMPVHSFTQERVKAREEETARLEERLASLRADG